MPRPPDPTALRRERKDDQAWIQLAPRPTDAPAPEWPLTVPPNDAERTHWETLWRTPQANEWVKNDEAQGVALFVRLLAQAEKPNAPVTLFKYVREFRNELGLSANGAATRRWRMPSAGAKPAAVTPIRVVGNRRSTRAGGTPALDLLARWLEQGVTFPPDTVQHADAVAELSALGIDLDPYDRLNQRGA